MGNPEGNNINAEIVNLFMQTYKLKNPNDINPHELKEFNDFQEEFKEKFNKKFPYLAAKDSYLLCYFWQYRAPSEYEIKQFFLSTELIKEFKNNVFLVKYSKYQTSNTDYAASTLFRENEQLIPETNLEKNRATLQKLIEFIQTEFSKLKHDISVPKTKNTYKYRLSVEKKIEPRIQETFDFVSYISDASKNKRIKAAKDLTKWGKFDKKHMYTELGKIKNTDVLDLLKNLKIIAPTRQTLVKKIEKNPAKKAEFQKLITRLSDIFKGRINIQLTDKNALEAVKVASDSVTKVLDSGDIVDRKGQFKMNFPPS